MAVAFNGNYLKNFMSEEELKALAPAVKAAHDTLHQKTGLGNDFLGWLDLPTNYDKEEFARIQKAAKKINTQADVLIVIGIGGSYLGARAAIELLRSPFYNNLKKDTADIYFVGNNVSPSYLQEVLSICEGRDIAVNVISKRSRLWRFGCLKTCWRKNMGKKAQKSAFTVPLIRPAAPLKNWPTKTAMSALSSPMTWADGTPF